jgi:hypothetical protein
MRGYQTFNYVLPSQAFSAGGRTVQTLRDIPKTMFGRFMHLWSFLFSVVITPTFTTAPTLAGQNNVFTAADFWDGSFMRFQGGFNHMRAKELLHTGRIRNPDADLDPASTNSRYYKRALHVGPPQYAGSPSDFVIPAGLLENGELRFSHGALTDISADTTAATGTVRVTARCVLLDELRIPPAYQWGYQALNAQDVNISGEAAYDVLALLNSASFDAITAGDFGDIRVDVGGGDMVPTVKSYDLTACFVDDFAAGEIGAVNGEPEAANDDNPKIVNRSTPTAVKAAPVDLQPVVWSPPETRISKLTKAGSVVRLRWGGGQTSAVLLYGRILPQVPTVIASLVAKATARLGVTAKDFKVKTLSKQDYDGPMGDYMPWKISL